MIRVIVEGLVKRYGQVAAVDGASLEIAPGELFCLLGPSGAGKTVLARLVAGLEDRDDGVIYFNERIVHALPPHERRVGLVFPDFALWPGMTVAENVAYPIKLKGLKGPERGQRVGEILTMLRIDGLGGKKPEQLSRAQALRVALARAVVTGPELLILDEPLEQFDTRGREEVWDEIRRLRGE
ncbi:MAG TPA: ATP-binding cassette domain-containing protein, partial [Isosphaeraceae bacterium]|nr:ATP-binding cassette domain-containing protein [Isosphaeraceae bacterium]